jgi:hypothetical protein
MGPPKDPQWAMREGDWKLIGNPREKTWKGGLINEWRRQRNPIRHYP